MGSDDGDAATIEAVTAHMTACFGAPTQVWHELASDLVHIDVHLIPPSEEHPSITLFTTGMSDLPMTLAPAATGAPVHAELMVHLPASWQLGEDALHDASRYWPVRWLMTLARLPHRYTTWLGWGHTIPNGDPAMPLAPGVPFTGFIIAPPTSLTEADAVVAAPGRSIALYAIYPLHPDELTLKLERGADALFALLDAAGVTDEIAPARPSTVPRRQAR
jgi:hypothetical protein